MGMNSGKKKVMILGSTGSIGANTLDVIRHQGDRFEVIALACARNAGALGRQIREFSPQAAALTGSPEAPEELQGLRAARPFSLYRGEDGLLRMIEEVEADIVVNGISGSKGLLPSLKALEEGKSLANANKESIVMAGPLIMEAARKNKVPLIPVDSEHYAIFSLLRKIEPTAVEEVILTASGGAFRDLPYEQWQNVSREDALTHPNWEMGPKNTIDSATMANKGLEFIETHYLFGIDVSRIKVVIHPQSYVHSLVRTVDGFLYAQISRPDMRMVIQNALSYPQLYPASFGSTDLLGRELTFAPVDRRKYRMLDLAREAARMGGAYPVVYNAANETALESFLNGRILFVEIPAFVEEILQAAWDLPVNTVEEILHLDRMSRGKAQDILTGKRKAV